IAELESMDGAVALVPHDEIEVLVGDPTPVVIVLDRLARSIPEHRRRQIEGASVPPESPATITSPTNSGARKFRPGGPAVNTFAQSCPSDLAPAGSRGPRYSSSPWPAPSPSPPPPSYSPARRRRWPPR